jgi:hypothetical protein
MSRSAAARRGWETRRERTDLASHNVPPELLPLWERTRWIFKGTPHERFEAFMQYVHERPEDVIPAQQDAADAWLASELRRREEPEEADEAPFDDPLAAENAALRSRLAAADEAMVRLHTYAAFLAAELEHAKGKVGSP